MLIIANSLDALDFEALMAVYIEANLENGAYFFPEEPPERQLELARQEFGRYLEDAFFKRPNARYYIWEAEGTYVSALRLEPQGDGFLMEALETRPDRRRKGYARELIQNALHMLPPGTRVYSHVSKRNRGSLAVHDVCGFQKILDHCVDSDGEINDRAVTLRYVVS